MSVVCKHLYCNLDGALAGEQNYKKRNADLAIQDFKLRHQVIKQLPSNTI